MQRCEMKQSSMTRKAFEALGIALKMTSESSNLKYLNIAMASYLDDDEKREQSVNSYTPRFEI